MEEHTLRFLLEKLLAGDLTTWRLRVRHIGNEESCMVYL